MTAYYNENDKFAAAWLRNLIAAGHIAPGDVDERSIEDVRPDDLRKYDQCHFFAGVGVWSHALRRAGWADNRPVWTGSCPCQPFSAAGKGVGFADERHLWPAWHHLISECKPGVVFGEQVASKDGLGWLDLVHADMEAAGYAFGAVDLCAAGVGAPHIRQRLWFVADSGCSGLPEQRRGRVESAGLASVRLASELADAANERFDGRRAGEASNGRDAARIEPERLRDACELADPQQHDSRCEAKPSDHAGAQTERSADRACRCGCASCELADADGWNASAERQQCGGEQRQQPQDCRRVQDRAAGPTNGFWRAADWIGCRDGKFRPVVATHVALVDGASSSVVSMRPGAEKEGEIANADLPTLQQNALGKDLPGRHQGIGRAAVAQEVLRQELHGARDGERALLQPEPQQIEGGHDSEVGVRDMWSGPGTARTPSGPRPAEQCAVELEDIVCCLPPSLSLAELYGDRGTAQALRVLQSAIYEAGLVLHSYQPVQAVWASLGEEAKDRIRVGFDASRWRKLVSFPLESGSRNRTGRLRGYGNAICAEVAQTVISAYMECRP